MIWGYQEVHQYPHISHRNSSILLVTMSCICLFSFECYTNAVMEQSCDWLHLFGGHGFDLLHAGRTTCSWVLMVVAQHLKKAIAKTHVVRH